jgi:hypothetical protein
MNTSDILFPVPRFLVAHLLPVCWQRIKEELVNKSRLLSISITFVACVISLSATAQERKSPPVRSSDEPEDVGVRGAFYAGTKQWKKLDALIEQLSVSGEKHEDGRPRLYIVTNAIETSLSYADPNAPQNPEVQPDEYAREIPTSAFSPIYAAMRLKASAWHARGAGYSSTITDENWKLFRERNLLALKKLMEVKARSAHLPVWYEIAISVGIDAGVPSATVESLFNEGIQRHSGYLPLYFAYARRFSPLWGGSYAKADNFVRSQLGRLPSADADMLYARLYWVLDQFGNQPRNFFVESQVDWVRMRNGFEMLMKAFPNSAWNQANLVAFSCRANDAETYLKWRTNVSAIEFSRAGPNYISIDICDAQFSKKI